MKSTKPSRAVLAALAAFALLTCSQAWALTTSDRLIVDCLGVKADVTVPELNPEAVIEVNNGGNPWLPKNGYVVITEPDGTTLSDILVSYTGSSLQLYSDGSPGFPTLDSLKQAGVPELGRFREDKNGIDVNVGNLFGTAATPIPANAIRVISDGNPVPDAAMTGPLLFVALARLAILRRQQERLAGSD